MFVYTCCHCPQCSAMDLHEILVYFLWACVLHGICKDIPAVNAQEAGVQAIFSIEGQDGATVSGQLSALGLNATILSEQNVIVVNPVCANGSYAVPGTQGQCAPCSKQPPESYVVSACTSGHDTVYGPCRICALQEYEYSPCGLANRICYVKGPPCPFLFQAGARGCVPSACPAGYTGQAGSCAACQAGRYKNWTGPDPCPSCIPGWYSGQNASTCLACQPGLFSAASGSSACQACQRGAYSSPSRLSCIACPAGKYTENAGSTSCTTCLPGLYSPAPGFSACLPCSGGKGVNQSRTACNPCIPGAYALDGVCYLCGAGKFNPLTGATACTGCPNPAFSPVLGATACSACPAGTFGAACEACKPGKYQPGKGASACLECPAGTYSSKPMAKSLEDCQNCEPGSYASNVTGCQPCPEFTTSPAASLFLHDCTPKAGYYAQAGKRALACPKGYYCPQGTTDPTICPRGTVSEAGQSMCIMPSSSGMIFDWILGSTWLFAAGGGVILCVLCRILIKGRKKAPRLYRRIQTRIIR